MPGVGGAFLSWEGVILLPDGKDDLREEAFAMYRQGFKLADIGRQLHVPAGTVRRWKHTDGWDVFGANEANETNAKANASANAGQRTAERRRKRVRSDVQMVAENEDLSDKQKMFCLYYVRYFNATKAYQKAYGCAYSTAAAQGYRLLENAKVKAEIDLLKKNRMNRELLDESDIFQKYMDIAFADVTDFLTFGQREVPVMGPFGPVTVTDPDTGEKLQVTKVVNVVQFRESDEVDGTLISEVKQGKDGASIKLADRMKALEWLADHMDLATPEQKARMRKLEAEAERICRSEAPDEDEGVVIVNDLPKDS